MKNIILLKRSGTVNRMELLMMEIVSLMEMISIEFLEMEILRTEVISI